MPSLDREQQRILDAIVRGSRGVAPAKRNRYLRAAIQTGLVESGLRNLSYGDADSQGWRQERASLYPDPTNVNASVRRFFQEAAKLDRGQSSWQLAADVQRPAEQYRGRYKDVARQAAGLLDGLGVSNPGGGGGQQTPTQGPTATPGQPSFGVQPGPDMTGLLASLMDDQPQAPPVGQLRQSATAASAVLPAGYRGIQSSGGPPPRRDLSSLLEAVSGLGAQVPGVTQPALPGDAQNGGKLPGQGSSKRAGRPKSGLGNAVSLVDGLVGQYGAPITAKQEPGHAVGGDHDPAVKGATARDIGGDEATRARIFRDLTRRLGVKGAVYKGEDINVTRGGVRYQIISRDHGTGPHLHIGMRRVR